ncbi:MAG: hypothetical protein ACOY94_26375 [Bacillota bacterium]
MMMTTRWNQTVDLPSVAGEPARERESRPSAEEVLIEEILKAAGLEALD